ncbi:MAG: bifunctional oligoribonuclease/PAP phosphatase NrnA [Candidatus Omnitrophota bacterium]
MDNENIKRVIEIFKTKNKFLITSHVNPEGDAIGSQLAVYYLLKKIGKQPFMADHDSVPENLRFLTGAELIANELSEDFSPDVVIVVDCPVKERAGSICECFDAKQFIVNIDHHVSNEFFGEVNWVEPEASSVGEMIFYLIKAMGVKLDLNMANAIYAAIITDTGMFNYSNTSAETHQAAGELISLGVEPKTMHDEIFEKKSAHEIKLLASVLKTLHVKEEGRLAHMELTRDMYRAEGIDTASTDDFINFPRSIRGVEITVFFKENGTKTDKINVSFRSAGKVDVNTIAAGFGGGGHPQASGCVLDCGLEEAKEKVLLEAKKILREK